MSLDDTIKKLKPDVPVTLKEPTVVEVAPPIKEWTFKEIMTATMPEVDYLIEDLIPKEGIAVCYGASGVFKTSLMLYISMLGADRERIIFDFKVKKPFKTLWIDEECRTAGMKTKIRQIYEGASQMLGIRDNVFGFRDPENVNKNIVVTELEFNLTDVHKQQQLLGLIQKHHPDLVVIDSISKIFREDEKDEKKVKQFYQILSKYVKREHVSFVLIHHCRKRDLKSYRSRDLEDISGSREFGAMTDSAFLVEETKKFGRFELKQTKNRYGQKHRPVTFEVKAVYGYIQLLFVDLHKEVIKQRTQEKVADILLAWMGSFDIKEFKTEDAKSAVDQSNTGYSEDSVGDALAFLIDKECIKRVVRGKYKVLKTEYPRRIDPTTQEPSDDEEEQPDVDNDYRSDF